MSLKLVLFGDSYTAGRIPHTSTDGALHAALVRHGVAESDILDLALSGSTVEDWIGHGDPARSCLARLDQACAAPSDYIAVGSLGGNDLINAVQHPDELVAAIRRDPLYSLACSLDVYRDLVAVLSRLTANHRGLLMDYPLPEMITLSSKWDVPFVMARYGLALTLKHAADAAGMASLDLDDVLGGSPDNFDGLDIHPSLVGYDRMAVAIIRKLTTK